MDTLRVGAAVGQLPAAQATVDALLQRYDSLKHQAAALGPPKLSKARRCTVMMHTRLTRGVSHIWGNH
jgi:hypothetical protein